jgi:hypothetical protein
LVAGRLPPGGAIIVAPALMFLFGQSCTQLVVRGGALLQLLLALLATLSRERVRTIIRAALDGRTH